MYAIISEGNLVSLCDRPRYVKVNGATGAYIRAQPEDAIALSVNGTLYNINGGEHIPGAPQAVVSEKDAGEYVFRSGVRIKEVDEQTGAAIVGVEEALCEVDVNTDRRISEVEEALCELDGIISGGGDN